MKKELVALYLGLSTAIYAQQFLIPKLEAEAKGSIPECENLPRTTSVQSTLTRQQTKRASPSANVTKFFIDQPEPGSRYETGPLHIIYSDGTEVVQTLPPLRASTDKETVFNAVGFSGVALAKDQQTLGWTVNVENCCTSYSIPLSLVLFATDTCFTPSTRGKWFGAGCSSKTASRWPWFLDRRTDLKLATIDCTMCKLASSFLKFGVTKIPKH